MQKLGYQSVELWTCGHHFLLDSFGYQNVKSIKNKASKFGLHIICLTPEQNNPKPNNIAAKDEELKKRTFAYFRNAIDAANELECEKVLVTSGWCYYSENRDEAWKRSVDMLGRLCRYAEFKGILLAMETLLPEETRLVTNIKTLKKMLTDVDSPNLKVTADLSAMSFEGETVQDFFDAFGQNVVHSHFVDDKPTDDHLAWGDGTRDLEDDLRVFKKNHYSGYFSLEYANSLYFEEPFQADKKTMQQFKKYMDKM